MFRVSNKFFSHLTFCLQNSDLTLLLKARCCMLLGTNDKHPDYIGHARAAVKLLDEDARDLVGDNGFPQVQLDEARRLLVEAEAQHAIDVAAQEKEDE